eukprot:16009466-Heterocapsa_arctica.AAC.1
MGTSEIRDWEGKERTRAICLTTSYVTNNYFTTIYVTTIDVTTIECLLDRSPKPSAAMECVGSLVHVLGHWKLTLTDGVWSAQRHAPRMEEHSKAGYAFVRII